MKKKTIIILIVVAVAVVFAILLFANAFGSPSTDKSPQTSVAATAEIKTPQPVNEPVPSASSAGSAPTASPAPSPTSTPSSIITGGDYVEYEDNKIEYEYYDVAEDTTKTDITELEASETLEYPLSIIARQLFSQELDDSPLKPNSIKLIDQLLYIDFTSSILKVNLGSAGEGAMLDEIASIYLNNIPDLKSVYISVDGSNYSSGHIEFSKDVPYKTKANLQ